MSIHWTLIAGFLYAEIAAVLFLLVPFISPKKWNSLFKSRFFKAIEGQSFFYFCVLLLILVLSFLDAVREMRKYSSGGHDRSDHASHHGQLDMEMQHHMRLFRAQRNFYISGFALFLCLVLRRLVTLLLTHASLETSNEAALRQAASASSAAEKLLSEQQQPAAAADDQQLQQLRRQLAAAETEREGAVARAEALLAQVGDTASEYDSLLAEHRSLQRAAGEAGDKKTD